MMDNTVLQQHGTGDVCPACEGEITVVGGPGENELHVECDCGRTLALGFGSSSLADAA